MHSSFPLRGGYRFWKSVLMLGAGLVFSFGLGLFFAVQHILARTEVGRKGWLVAGAMVLLCVWWVALTEIRYVWVDEKSLLAGWRDGAKKRWPKTTRIAPVMLLAVIATGCAVVLVMYGYDPQDDARNLLFIAAAMAIVVLTLVLAVRRIRQILKRQYDTGFSGS